MPCEARSGGLQPRLIALNGRSFQITRLSELGISHVSDNVVLLQYLRQPDVIQRTLTVIKTRASLHQPQVREFTITPKGITLQAHDA